MNAFDLWKRSAVRHATTSGKVVAIAVLFVLLSFFANAFAGIEDGSTDGYAFAKSDSGGDGDDGDGEGDDGDSGDEGDDGDEGDGDDGDGEDGDDGDGDGDDGDGEDGDDGDGDDGDGDDGDGDDDGDDGDDGDGGKENNAKTGSGNKEQSRIRANALSSASRASGARQVNISQRGIEVRFNDGAVTKIRNGTYIFRGSSGRVVSRRAVTGTDIALIRSIVRGFSVERLKTSEWAAVRVVRAKSTRSTTRITYSNEWAEQVKNGQYSLIDSYGRAVVRRPASAADRARLKKAINP